MVHVHPFSTTMLVYQTTNWWSHKPGACTVSSRFLDFIPFRKLGEQKAQKHKQLYTDWDDPKSGDRVKKIMGYNLIQRFFIDWDRHFFLVQKPAKKWISCRGGLAMFRSQINFWIFPVEMIFWCLAASASCLPRNTILWQARYKHHNV